VVSTLSSACCIKVLLCRLKVILSYVPLERDKSWWCVRERRVVCFSKVCGGWREKLEIGGFRCSIFVVLAVFELFKDVPLL